MTERTALELIPLLLLTTFGGSAGASGFQLTADQNMSGLGNAQAGSAAVAENASTIFFNPAGMTQLQEREFSGGIQAIMPSMKFSNGASNATGLSGNGGNGGSAAFVPNAYLSWAVTRDLYLGVGLGAPFGLKSEYGHLWTGAAQSEHFGIKTLNINPSIAYRVTDQLSLGFGVDWQKFEAEYRKVAGVNLVPGVVNFAGVTSVLKARDTSWSWNAGALFKLSPATKIGVSYRAAVKYKLKGSNTLTSDGTAEGNTALGLLNASVPSYVDASANLKLPEVWIFSIAHKLNGRWEVLTDLSRTGWSSIQRIDIIQSSGVPLTSINSAFRDTWRIAFGTNYQLNDAYKLKLGMAYDQTPVKGADTRMVSLPDNNRISLSAGVQWKSSETTSLDVGVAYVYFKKSPIHNDQTGERISAGLVDGTFNNHAWLLGSQYSITF